MKKLNEIADHIADLLTGKKSRTPSSSPDPDSDQPQDDDPAASKAQKVQKSIRKATGGMKEPC